MVYAYKLINHSFNFFFKLNNLFLKEKKKDKKASANLLLVGRIWYCSSSPVSSLDSKRNIATHSSTMSSNDRARLPDPYTQLGLIRNPDGSITRVPDFYPTTPPCSDPAAPIPVLTKDIPINPHNQTWARIYLPRPESAAGKLPLIVFFHGGGFVVCSAASSMFQKFCGDVVRHIPAVMVSVEYRNAPEHRLPAAYDDCFEALQWLRTTGEEWLTQYADFSRCFLMGHSAGGNIAYHVGLRAVAAVDQLMPLKIQGLILQDPFFSGEERTPSEIRLADDTTIPLHLNDLMWELALPVRANRDHEYSNPMKAPRLELLEMMKKQGWRFLVTGYRGDPLVDREIALVKMLREKGLNVMEKFSDGGFHGVDFVDEVKGNIFCGVLKDFLLSF